MTKTFRFRPGLLRRRRAMVSAGLRLLDLACLAAGARFACIGVGCEGFGPGVGGLPSWAVLLAAGLVLAAGLFGPMGLYRPWRGVALESEARALVNSSLALFALLALAALVLAPHLAPPKPWWLLWLVSTLALLSTVRLARRLGLYWLRGHGFNQRHVLLVGTGPRARYVARKLRERPWTGLRVAGFVAQDPTLPGEALDGVPVVGTPGVIAEAARADTVDEVWIAADWAAREVEQIVKALDHTAVQLRLVPDSSENHGAAVSRLAGIPVVNLSASPIVGLRRLLKALEDYVLAAVLLIVASPVMVLVAAAVKLSSPGPVLYRQVRLTRDGRPFQMLKFRSMPVHAESHSGPVWAKPGERRATRVGAFLRRTSLDELPQLFNVLAGHMSIVGPRPERPVFVERFKYEVPGYMRKHLVKAGITGWAQVNGWRGDTSLAERIEHDLYYIENWSLWLDLKIVMLTPLKGLVHQNAY